MPADAASDEQLIARTRTGDMDAYDELYRRHVDDASKVARIVTNNSDEAQDIVAEAFTRVLTRLREGGGPEGELTPYLRTIVRRLAIDRHRSSQRDGDPSDPSALDVLPRTDDPMARATNRQLVRHAFETLPERWQQVLWHTEIEGRSAASLAPALGSSPNAVAALAYRAREGLRQAYLAVNLSAEVLPECRSYAPKVAPYVRGTLSAHDTREMSAHLAQCSHCRERRDELLLLVSDMRGVLWPALLLPASAAATAAAAGAAGAAGGGVLAFLSPTSWGKRAKQLAGAGAGVAAAGVLAASAYLLVSGDDADEPSAAPSDSSQQEPDEPGAPADPAPEDPPAPEDDAAPESEPGAPDAEAPADDPEPDDPAPNDPAPDDPAPNDPAPDDPAPESDDPESPDVEPSQPSEPPETSPTDTPPDPTPSTPPSDPPVADEPPQIDVQPPPTTVVAAGRSVTLRVRVSGSPPPELQWQYADPPDGADGSGDGSSQAADSAAGDHAVTSEQAFAGVFVPAAWTSTSSPPTATPGHTETPTPTPTLTPTPTETPSPTQTSSPTPTPTVSVTNSPSPSATEPSKPEVPDERDWVDLEGETSDTLVLRGLSSEDDGRSYRVLARNPSGTVATKPAVLKVQYEPEVSAHPEDVEVEEHGTATFEAVAVANPAPMSVTWQVRKPGGEWDDPSNVRSERGETGSTIEISDVGRDLDGNQYRAVFGNDVGSTASKPATLSVHWAPEVTDDPADITVYDGDDAAFTATSSANPGASWQWQKREADAWTPVDGAAGGPGDDASLTISDTDVDDDGSQYRVVFTNGLGSATSAPAGLTVLPPTGSIQFVHPDGSTECVSEEQDQGTPSQVAKLADCTGEQLWELPGDGTIRSAATDQCLDSHRLPFLVTVHDCDGSSSQQWDVSEGGDPQQISAGSHGFCMDAREVSAIDRGPGGWEHIGLWLLPCEEPSDTYYESQLFRFVRADAG